MWLTENGIPQWQIQCEYAAQYAAEQIKQIFVQKNDRDSTVSAYIQTAVLRIFIFIFFRSLYQNQHAHRGRGRCTLYKSIRLVFILLLRRKILGNFFLRPGNCFSYIWFNVRACMCVCWLVCWFVSIVIHSCFEQNSWIFIIAFFYSPLTIPWTATVRSFDRFLSLSSRMLWIFQYDSMAQKRCMYNA